jgi:tetratricopeptide (TPR) repeat protein
MGCGGVQRVKPPVTTFNFEPVVVRAPKPGENLNFYDAKEVFNRGRLARSFEQYKDCIRFFGMVIDEFPNSKYAHPALYNRGLCYESDDDAHAAAKDFETFAQKANDPESRLDGLFRLLHNLVDIEHNSKALQLTRKLLNLKLEKLDQAEVLAKQGHVLHRLGQHELTRPLLLKSSRLAREGANGLIHGNAVYAEAEYLLGEINLQSMLDIRLKLPLEKMKYQLTDKLKYFRKSQLHFLNAVKAQIKGFSSHAGERLGALYAGLYDDLLSAEKPADLTAQEVSIYYEELILRVTPVLRNAITIYEKSLRLGRRLGEKGIWLEQVNQQKERLEKLLRDIKPTDKVVTP